MPTAILRMVLAVAAGYAAASIVVMVGTMAAVAAFRLEPSAAPTTSYLAANVAVSILGAAVAGYLCARLAPTGRITLTVGVLVIVFLALAIVSARTSLETGQPRSYVALVTLLGIIGLWAGVMVERAVHGRRRTRELTS